jgi:hypothetical protein
MRFKRFFISATGDPVAKEELFAHIGSFQCRKSWCVTAREGPQAGDGLRSRKAIQ